MWGLNRKVGGKAKNIKNYFELYKSKYRHCIILGEERIYFQRKYLGITDDGLKLSGLKEELA